VLRGSPGSQGLGKDVLGRKHSDARQDSLRNGTYLVAGLHSTWKAVVKWHEDTSLEEAQDVPEGTWYM
jgi:hypothetical protein